MRGKAQRVARPAQTCLQNAGVTGPNFTKFVSHVIGGVSARIHVAIFPSVVERQRTE